MKIHEVLLCEDGHTSGFLRIGDSGSMGPRVQDAKVIRLDLADCISEDFEVSTCTLESITKQRPTCHLVTVSVCICICICRIDSVAYFTLAIVPL